MGRRWLIGGVIGLALLAAFGFVLWALNAMWRLGGDTPLSIHGWIAVALAFTLTGVIGGGLMWLAFYSARHGWDDIDRDP